MWVILYKGTCLWHIYVKEDGNQEFHKRELAARELDKIQNLAGCNYEKARVIKCS